MASNSKEIGSVYFPPSSMLSVHPICKRSYTFNDITSEGLLSNVLGSLHGLESVVRRDERTLSSLFMSIGWKLVELWRVRMGSDGDCDKWPIAVADGR